MQNLTKFKLPIIVFLLGCLGCAFVTKVIVDFENEKTIVSFENNAKAQVDSLEQTLNGYLLTLTGLKAFFDSSHYISRQEFDTLTLPYISSHQNVQALGWVPIVKAADKESLELKAWFDGVRGFKFKQIDSDGRLIPVTARKTYYPVFYLSSSTNSELKIGFDFGSDELGLSALHTATNEGKSTASGLHLSQSLGRAGAQAPVTLFVAIYNKEFTRSSALLHSSAAKREAVVGFGLLAFSVEKMVSHLAKNSRSIIRIDDVTNPSKPLSLYSPRDLSESIVDLSVTKNIYVAGKIWRISVYPTEGSYKLNSGPVLWVSLILGFLSTVLITYYLVQLIKREDIISEKVRLKTIELADSEFKANMMLDTAVEAIITVDSQGGICSLNKAAKELFGYQESDVLGESYTQLIVSGMPTETDGFDSVVGGLAQTLEVVCIKKDGSQFDGGLTHSKFYLAGETLFSLFLRDISRRKEHELERESLIEQLNESNDDLERFAYVASHDLQEPIRMVYNFTALLEKEYGDSLDATAHQYMTISRDAAERMQTLVTDLLTYSKVGTGTDVSESIDSAKTVKYIQQNLRDNIEKTGAQIRCGALPMIVSNASQFSSLMQNLISNSVKYRKPDQSPIIDVSGEAKGDNWRFTVKDNGIGIEEKYFELVFQPFKRLHTQKEFKGTGIGLAICAKIVSKLNGRIWVESEYGKGTTISFEIPRVSSEDILNGELV